MSKCNRAMPHHRLRCFLKGLCNFLVHLIFKVEYLGQEHIPEDGPLILIANHTSVLDMFAIHVRIDPWIHWVAKKELYKSRFMTWLLDRLGCIAVNRDKIDLSAARGMMQVLKRQEIIGLFPQGKRVRDDEINSVYPRTGAVHFATKTNIPLLPVAIKGKFRPFSRIQVVFGEPFRIEQPLSTLKDNNSLERLSLAVMQRVYDLIDYNNVYQLEDDIAL